MKLNSFVAVARALEEAGVRYLVSLATLIDMKTAVGRPQDLIDVEHLKMRLNSDARK
jgi:hypothetical protein